MSKVLDLLQSRIFASDSFLGILVFKKFGKYTLAHPTIAQTRNEYLHQTHALVFQAEDLGHALFALEVQDMSKACFSFFQCCNQL